MSLELNSAGHWASRAEFGDLCCRYLYSMFPDLLLFCVFLVACGFLFFPVNKPSLQVDQPHLYFVPALQNYKSTLQKHGSSKKVNLASQRRLTPRGPHQRLFGPGIFYRLSRISPLLTFIVMDSIYTTDPNQSVMVLKGHWLNFWTMLFC